jgi:hypothetical protein
MFLYFVPANESRPPDALSYAFDGPTFTRVSTASGPLGMPAGTIFGAGEVVRLDVASQQWAPIPNTPYAIGKPTHWTPRPEELARQSQLPGHWITMNDGSRWLVAIAHGFDPARETFYTPLPRALELDRSTGKWQHGPVLKQHRRFLDLAVGFVNAQTAAHQTESKSFVYEPVDDLAMAGLSTNYRISSIELSFFEEAYTADVRRKILDAILDYPTLKEWQTSFQQKKNQ